MLRKARHVHLYRPWGTALSAQCGVPSWRISSAVPPQVAGRGALRSRSAVVTARRTPLMPLRQAVTPPRRSSQSAASPTQGQEPPPWLRRRSEAQSPLSSPTGVVSSKLSMAYQAVTLPLKALSYGVALHLGSIAIPVLIESVTHFMIRPFTCSLARQSGIAQVSSIDWTDVLVIVGSFLPAGLGIMKSLRLWMLPAFIIGASLNQLLAVCLQALFKAEYEMRIKER